MSTATDDLIFGQLNERQREAVRTLKGPVLILAGAGSGKTRALTHRIAYLMQQGVPPWQILAVTFTNKAATEMKERIKHMLHLTEGLDTGIFSDISAHTGKMPIMGTFHSICVRILRRDIEHLGRDRNFVIYDTDDQEKLMKQILKDLHIEESELKARAALSMISRFKSEALSPEDALKQAKSDRMHLVVQAYKQYRKALREHNAMDFDDLILETVRLFHEHPDVLERYQETWRFIHVDEYQDTNHGQYLLISLLAKKYRNLCVIGDPDQSIYGFRGADIRNILEFEAEYPDAVRIKLEQNYRSTQPILSAADAVIAHNPDRPEKSMWTERKEGPHIILHETSDERREAAEAIKAVEQMVRDGIPLKEQVILYRTHAQSRVFEEACMRAGIPYRILGGVKFYARKEVKDVLGYLYAILNPYDTVSMLRIINVPARKIGQTTMERIQAHASVNAMTLWDSLCDIESITAVNQPTKERIAAFVSLIKRFKERSLHEPVSQLTDSLLQELQLEKWLTEGEENGEERWQNVRELLTVMHKYDHLEPHVSLTSFLEEVALVSEVDKLSEGQQNSLTLMTLHLCKGLEFEHVVIVGCEEGIFPHSNSLFDKAQLEEERRIMYVGMTRAKTHLRLLCCKQRFQWGEQKANPPSRFLDDLPDHLLERRSDDVLSAFAWAAGRAQSAIGTSPRSGAKLEPFRQHQDIDIEFNQDTGMDEIAQEDAIDTGTHVEHPIFGRGVVTARRGDIVDIRFANGKTKTLALSIAPLKVI